LIDRLLEPPPPIEPAFEQGRGVGGVAVGERVSANPDQPKSSDAIGLSRKQASRGVG